MCKLSKTDKLKYVGWKVNPVKWDQLNGLLELHNVSFGLLGILVYHKLLKMEA